MKTPMPWILRVAMLGAIGFVLYRRFVVKPVDEQAGHETFGRVANTEPVVVPVEPIEAMGSIAGENTESVGSTVSTGASVSKGSSDSTD